MGLDNPPPLIVQNLVFKCILNQEVNQRWIVQNMKGRAIYNPRRFAAVVSRSVKPRIALLTFSSGKMVCTGAKNPDQARFIINQNIEELKKMGYRSLEIKEFKIENMVCSAVLPYRINRESLSQSIPLECTFDHEQFPGVIWRHPEIAPITLLVFESGNLVLTGAVNTKTAKNAFDKVLPILQTHKISPSTLADSSSMEDDDSCAEGFDSDSITIGGQKRRGDTGNRGSSQKIRKINSIASELDSEQQMKKLIKQLERETLKKLAVDQMTRVEENMEQEVPIKFNPYDDDNHNDEKPGEGMQSMPIFGSREKSIKSEQFTSNSEEKQELRCDHCNGMSCENLNLDSEFTKLFGGLCCRCEELENLCRYCTSKMKVE